MGIVGDQLVGPIFLEGNLSAQSYLAMLTETLLPLLENCGVQADDMWWQQDGAPAHDSNAVRNYLNERYPNRWIGLKSPVRKWPARSPDHTILDFYLWGRVKYLVYQQVKETFVNLLSLTISFFKLNLLIFSNLNSRTQRIRSIAKH